MLSLSKHRQWPRRLRLYALDALAFVVKADSQLIKSANAGKTNSHIREKVRVVRGMVENEQVQKDVLRSGKVDTIISEPIGVMLLHERMVRMSFVMPDTGANVQVESFILARDLFLKPGGQMLPSAGHIFFSPFTDEALFNETDQKVSLPTGVY